MAHDGTTTGRDVFEWLITMIAPEVVLDLVPVQPIDSHSAGGEDYLERDRQHAEQLRREVKRLCDAPPSAAEFVRLARAGNYDMAVLPWSAEMLSMLETETGQWVAHVMRHCSCNVFLAAHAAIPKEVAAEAVIRYAAANSKIPGNSQPA